MSVYYATVRISPWHWLSLRISSMAWSIPKVSPRTPHVWRNTFNKRQVEIIIIMQGTGGSPACVSCQGGCQARQEEADCHWHRHYNRNWFQFKSESESQCNNVRDTVSYQQYLGQDYKWHCYSGSDQVHTAAPILQHHVHGRPGRRGVLQYRGGAAPQEARHQPGSRLSCEVSLPDWGETSTEWFQRQVKDLPCWLLSSLLPNSIICFKLPSN